MLTTKCIWRREVEDEDGNVTGLLPCGKPATHISCVPNDVSPTCEEHKCRCAQPIEKSQPVKRPLTTAGQTFPRWRVGSKVPRNVYCGDEPIFVAPTEELARHVVDGMNYYESLEG